MALRSLIQWVVEKKYIRKLNIKVTRNMNIYTYVNCTVITITAKNSLPVSLKAQATETKRKEEWKKKVYLSQTCKRDTNEKHFIYSLA